MARDKEEAARRLLLERIVSDVNFLRLALEHGPVMPPCCWTPIGTLCNSTGSIVRNAGHIGHDPRPACDHRHHAFEVWLA